MSSIKIVSVLLIGMFLVPFAAANHGLSGKIVATMSDGSIATAKITYVTGNFNTQTWAFSWTTSSGGSANCNGFGSIEIGFTSVASCSTPFSTGGTGDSHAYPYSNTDVHSITVTFGGVDGEGTQVVCPDSGAAAGPCGTVARL